MRPRKAALKSKGSLNTRQTRKSPAADVLKKPISAGVKKPRGRPPKNKKVTPAVVQPAKVGRKPKPKILTSDEEESVEEEDEYHADDGDDGDDDYEEEEEEEIKQKKQKTKEKQPSKELAKKGNSNNQVPKLFHKQNGETSDSKEPPKKEGKNLPNGLLSNFIKTPRLNGSVTAPDMDTASVLASASLALDTDSATIIVRDVCESLTESSTETDTDAPIPKNRRKKTKSSPAAAKEVPEVFTCGDCGYTASSSTDVVDHECAGRRRFECMYKSCGARFAHEEALQDHVAVHNVFTCDFCKKGFGTKALLKNHMRTHLYDSLNMQIDAVERNETGERQETMERQPQSEETETNDDDDDEDDSNSDSSPSRDASKEDLDGKDETNNMKTSEEKRKEDIEKKKRQKKLQKHSVDKYMQILTVKSERKFVCKICDKSSNYKADLRKHIRTHTGERPYKCKYCDAAFVQITALHSHQTRHTGKKPFVCDVCSKMFATKDRLRLHMRLHTGEKPNSCDRCPKSFARRSQLTAHIRRHDGYKPSYECEECGQVFTSYHTMKSHSNAHKGIKEFQCGACGKKFVRVEGIHKHIRTVHHGSRPYTCQVCGKAFKGHLQQHMRLHSGLRPYECSTCHASFTQNSQLTVHMRIHTGERPYKCQVCGSSFAHSSACKIHMRSHTGEKPFRCVMCQTTFSQLPHLKKHMKCVHNAAKPYLCTLCTKTQSFFQTQKELDHHKKVDHQLFKTPEQEAEEIVEDASLNRLRNRLAVLLYRISSDERRSKFGFGSQLIDEVLKKSLMSSGHKPVIDPTLSRLTELRHNAHLLLKWTIPKETMEEYHRNNMTVDEVIEMLTS